MRLYLVRHGIALDVGEQGVTCDDERPLSDKGRSKTAKVGRGLAWLGARPQRILSSPLPRAEQTASILAEQTKCGAEVETLDALRPGADAEDVLGCLRDAAAGEVMLVGHMPDMAAIAGGLLDAGEDALVFKKAGVACIAFEETPALGRGELEWLMEPSHLAALGRKGGKA